MDAEAETVGMQAAIGNVENHAPLGRATVKVMDFRTRGQHVFIQPQHVFIQPQRGKAGQPPEGAAFQTAPAASRGGPAALKTGRRQTGDAATHNGDIQFPH